MFEAPSGLEKFTTFVDWGSGALSGDGIHESTKLLGQMQGMFQDAERWSQMDPATSVYRVQYWKPVPDGTAGGLFWGNSTVLPGKVGDEFFMTKGHFHAQLDRAEYYATVSGEGLLLLMDMHRKTECLSMKAGRVHYIPGGTAHRVVNTGTEPLVLLACWCSDAGYDYRTIADRGFSVRVIDVDGRPSIIPQP
ncbi:MAG: glucose-6-phosphate isomerase family protein [Bryobacteraceae bacterium]